MIEFAVIYSALAIICLINIKTLRSLMHLQWNVNHLRTQVSERNKDGDMHNVSKQNLPLSLRKHKRDNGRTS